MHNTIDDIELIKDSLRWNVERRSDMYVDLDVQYVKISSEGEDWITFEIAYLDGDEDRETWLTLHEDGREKVWQVGAEYFGWLENAVGYAMMISQPIN